MNIELGDKLFEFSSEQDWINRAQRAWRCLGLRADEDTVCVDAIGRVCRIGRDFITATKDSAYPISIYLYRNDRYKREREQ